MKLRQNLRPAERVVHIIAGLVILSLAFWGAKNTWFLLGLVPVATGMLGWSPSACALLGADGKSCEINADPKEEPAPMNLDKAVMRFAALVILASLALAYWFSPYWLGLTAFAGLNMLQASFTGFCPAAIIFRKLGIRPGNAFK
jgi:hypothetical protein